MNNQKELRELLKTARIICSSLDLNKTLEIAIKSLCKITGCQYGSIYLIDEQDPEFMVLATSCNFKKPTLRYQIKDLYFASKIFKTKKPIEITNLSVSKLRDKFTAESKHFFKELGINYFIYLPIVRDKRSIGLVNLYRKENMPGKKIDLDNIMLLIEQLAIAIENAKTHRDLKNEKIRWKTLFEENRGIAIIDRNHKIIDANKTFKNFLDEKDVTNRKIIDFIPGDEEKIQFTKELDRNFSEKRTIGFELPIETKHSIVWVRIRVRYIDLDGSKVAVLTFKDYTEQKELESGKNEFVYIVSHELRSPLTAMIGFLGLLKRDEIGPLNEKQKFFLKRASESTMRMINLVENILDVNRIDTGRINLNLSPIDLRIVFDQVKRDLKQSSNAKNLEIKTRGVKSIYIMGDKDRMYQIFYNLLDNAIKYSLPNGIIEAEFKTGDGKGIVSVSDNGAGIPPVEQKKLFTKFAKINSTLEIFSSGTGLGLYIVKNLVLAHNGRIWLQSRKNKGTSFFVEFPIAKQLSLIK
ncbi:MAG: ATP-binding protein [Patescibacteria group bacterium]|nr:ATP-binding protein [Patescibacteria group bacterium]